MTHPAFWSFKNVSLSGSTLHSELFSGAVVARLHGGGADGSVHMDIAISGSGSAASTQLWSTFFAPGTRVVALPGWSNPRLFIPAGGILYRWKASGLYPAFRTSARIYRFVLRILATLSLLPSRRTPHNEGRFQDLVAQYLPGSAAHSLLIGTPGPGQKLTIECRDAARRVIGYVKYANSAVARQQLKHESQILASLPAGTGPELVACTDWRNAVLQWTKPVIGRPVRATMPPPISLATFVRSLTLPNSEFEIEDHPWALRAHGFPEVVQILHRLRGRRWPAAIQHGDLAAWNVRYVEAGRLRAFDWEYGSLEGLPYLDAAHFILQHAALIARRQPDDGRRRAAEYLSSVVDTSLSSAEADAFVRLSAFDAFLNDPSPEGAPLQKWRQDVWRAPA